MYFRFSIQIRHIALIGYILIWESWILSLSTFHASQWTIKDWAITFIHHWLFVRLLVMLCDWLKRKYC
jgi:hypothetical protein